MTVQQTTSVPDPWCAHFRALREPPGGPPRIVDPDDREKMWAKLDRDRNFAVMVIRTWFGVSIGAAVINVALNPLGTSQISRLATGLLLLVSALVMIRWWMATEDELKLLKEVAHDAIQPLPEQEGPLVLFAAFALGLLPVFASFPPSYVLGLIALRIVDIWGAPPLYRHIREGVCLARSSKLDDKHADAFNMIERYYLGHPWGRLASIGFVLGAVALAFEAWGIGKNASLDPTVLIVAVTIVAVALIGHEAMVWLWRRSYLRSIRALGFLW